MTTTAPAGTPPAAVRTTTASPFRELCTNRWLRGFLAVRAVAAARRPRGSSGQDQGRALMRGTAPRRDSAGMPTHLEQAPTPLPRPAGSAARSVCALALVLLALGQLVGYLVLTAEPNPGIAATAVLPLAAAAAVLLVPGALGPVAALAVVATIVATRTVELPFDLARPGQDGPFAFAVAQLVACGVAAATAARLLLPADRGRTVALPVVAGLAGAALVVAALLVLAPQEDLTGGLTDEELAALAQVSMVDYRFEPAQLRVAAGEPFAVTFTNDGARPHSFAVAALDLDVLVPSGRSRTVVVRLDAGTYDFVCSVGDHEQEGMEGRVVVVGADGVVAAGRPEPGDAGDHAHHHTHHHTHHDTHHASAGQGGGGA